MFIFHYSLIFLPPTGTNLHQYGAASQVPYGEEVGDSLGNLLHGRFLGIFLDKGMSMQGLESTGGGHLYINRGLPVGIAQHLTFGEEDDIIGKRVEGFMFPLTALQGYLLVYDDNL